MKKRVLAMAFAILIWASSPSEAAWLHWTNPISNMGVDDSGDVFCAPSAPLDDLSRIRVYRLASMGAVPQLVDSVNALSREGLEDSVEVHEGPGAYFGIASVDTAGNESCMDQIVFVGPLTGIGDVPSSGRTRFQLFDVQGRTAVPGASGVYFWMELGPRGKRTGKKVVVK